MRAGRRAGLLLPLFSLRSRHDWGIGEIGDVAALCVWMAGAGHRWLQLLPIAEMTPGERSPYGALSAFAIDPIYLSLDRVEDFVAAGGEATLEPALQACLAQARAAAGIDYGAVRTVKRRALEIAFTRFRAAGGTAAGAFERFRAGAADWLEDYALFRALKEHHAEQAWTAWVPALAARAPEAVAAARRSLAEAVLFHEYVQWQASEQWAAAQAAARAAGVTLAGDLPFGVAADSADVWARQDEFRLEASIGAPPDAFNDAGQDWGLPALHWEAMGRGDFAWLRRRMARLAGLFDGCRLDHVVGYYRTWIRVAGAPPAFEPPVEADQLARGDRLLREVRTAAAGTVLLAEDLGVIPEFVRRSLADLALPGYRVLRWETDGTVFRDPRRYPPCSVATSGTHDTSSLSCWWTDEVTDETRAALAAVPSLAALAGAGAAFTSTVHETLLEGLYGAGSDLVLLPFQDAYGGRERINVPATVTSSNWGYRIPWVLETLPAQGLAERLGALAARHGR